MVPTDAMKYLFRLLKINFAFPYCLLINNISRNKVLKK